MTTRFDTKPVGPHNQDRVAVLERQQGRVVVVLDGAGGSAGGDDVAERALERLRDIVATLDRPGPAECAAWLRNVDAYLSSSAQPGLCAAVVVFFDDDHVCGASVGDCEAWLIRDGAYEILTQGQQRKPMVGSGCARPVGFGPIAFEGTLILGSDGLFKYVRPAVILRNAEREDPSAALVEQGRLPSGNYHDDITVAVCRPPDRPARAGAHAVCKKGDFDRIGATLATRAAGSRHVWCERVQGALLGGFVGDAFGCPFEGTPVGALRGLIKAVSLRATARSAALGIHRRHGDDTRLGRDLGGVPFGGLRLSRSRARAQLRRGARIRSKHVACSGSSISRCGLA